MNARFCLQLTSVHQSCQEVVKELTASLSRDTAVAVLRQVDLQHPEGHRQRLARRDRERAGAEDEDSREIEGSGWVGAGLDCLDLL